MPKPTKGPRLGGSPAHQKAILSNLATNLFEHGSITTTEAKARRLRPFAERLITKAKRGDLHNRRQALSVIRDKTVVHVLFTEIGPRYVDRPGGYTRITKIGPRKGDNAPMAVIELVEEQFTPKVRSTRPIDRAGASAAPAAPAPAAAVDAPPPADVAVDEAVTPADESDEAVTPADEVADEAVTPADEDAVGVDSATIDPDVTAPGATVEPDAAESPQAPVESTGGEGVSAEGTDEPAPAEPAPAEPTEETTGGEPVPPADGTDETK